MRKAGDGSAAVARHLQVSRTDKGGIFGSASAMKVDAIREPSEFAAGRGKVAIPLHIREAPAAPGGFASVEYQFRVLDKSDPEARRVSLVPRSDAAAEFDAQKRKLLGD